VTSTGAGETLNISSGGIAFTSDHTFEIGASMECSIRWPVLLNNVTPIKLVVEGRVVRSDGQFTAVEIRRHEFRTQKQ